MAAGTVPVRAADAHTGVQPRPEQLHDVPPCMFLRRRERRIARRHYLTARCEVEYSATLGCGRAPYKEVSAVRPPMAAGMVPLTARYKYLPGYEQCDV